MGEKIFSLFLVADAGTAGLKIAGIGDRTDFTVGVLPGELHLQVDRFGRAETEVPRTKGDETVG